MRSRRWKSPASHEVTKGVLLLGGGGGVLIGLLLLSMNVKLDSFLMVSAAIYNLIRGLQDIGQGMSHMLWGLGQMLGLIALAAVALTALVSMASGSIRIGLKLMPQLGALWSLLAAVLNGLIQLMSLPQRPRATPERPTSLSRSERLQAGSPRKAA